MAFVEQRKAALVRNGAVLSIIAALMNFVAVVYSYVFDTEFLKSAFSTEVPGLGLTVQLLSQAVLFFALMMYVMVLRTSCLVDKIGAVQLEFLSAALMSVCMLVIVLTSHVNITRMLGYGNEIYQGMGFECTSDSVPVLAIDGIITASHVGLPVRWRLLLPMEFLGVFLYAFIVFIRGSCEQASSFYNLVCLTGLVITSAIGKRTAESWERQCFETVICERQMRCEAEYQLSQAAEERPGRGALDRKDREDRSSSAPTQTPSMVLFDVGRDGVEGTAAQLTRIEELGRAEHWFIHPKAVDILHDERLGQGSFGTVFKGIFCGMIVAVKQPRQDMQNMNLTSLCNELCILRRLRHPNIIATFGAIIDAERTQVTLVLEFLEGTTLHTFILKAFKSDGCQDARPYVRFKLMLGVSLALKYMHSREPQLLHGDLKSNNIMVEGLGDNANAKLLDFGLSRVRVRGARPLGGTLAWMAPEVALCIGKVKCSADIFSYGRLLAFIATGILPLAGLHAHTVKQMMSRGALPRPNWPDGCVFKPFCKKLVETCLVFNETARPSISRVHGELLGLPGKMDLGGTGTTFIRNVEAVAIKQGIAMGDDGSLMADLQPRPTDIALNTAASVPEDEPLPAEVSGEDEPLPADVSGQIQSDFQPGIPLLFPGMRPTDTQVMVDSLFEVMTRWNFEVANGFCCPMHASARMANQMCNTLLDQPCATQGFVRNLGEQCGRCGMLGLPDNPVGKCDVCTEGVSLLQSTSAASGRTTCTSL